MSEGSSVPKTWSEAIPYLVWFVIVLGFGLEGVSHLINGEYYKAIFAFVGMFAMSATMIYWTRVKLVVRVEQHRWLAGACLVMITALSGEIPWTKSITPNIDLGVPTTGTPPGRKWTSRDVATRAQLTTDINKIQWNYGDALGQLARITEGWEGQIRLDRKQFVSAILGNGSRIDSTALSIMKLFIEYPEYQDLFSTIDQCQMLRSRAAIYTFTQTVLTLPDPLPQNWEASVRPALGLLNSQLVSNGNGRVDCGPSSTPQ